MVVVKRSVRKVGRSDHRSAVSKYVQLGVKVAHAANAGTSFEQLAQSSDIAGNSGKVAKVEPGDDLNSRGFKRQKVLDGPCFDERADYEKLATVDNERFGELVAPSCPASISLMVIPTLSISRGLRRRTRLPTTPTCIWTPKPQSTEKMSVAAC